MGQLACRFCGAEKHVSLSVISGAERRNVVFSTSGCGICRMDGLCCPKRLCEIRNKPGFSSLKNAQVAAQRLLAEDLLREGAPARACTEGKSFGTAPMTAFRS